MPTSFKTRPTITGNHGNGAAKATSGTSKRRSHNVHFEFVNASAHKVCVAGSFNDWQPERATMNLKRGGKWETDLRLSPGTYEYRIVVDGRWMPDPNGASTILNTYGERNSVITVR